MKNTLQILLLGVLTAGSALAQSSVTGPSSSQSPFLNPTIANSTITSVFTASQAVGGYTAAGLMDGAGAWDNGNGTFSMLIAHEMQSNAGATHAHGSTGGIL